MWITTPKPKPNNAITHAGETTMKRKGRKEDGLCGRRSLLLGEVIASLKELVRHHVAEFLNVAQALAERLDSGCALCMLLLVHISMNIYSAGGRGKVTHRRSGF